MTAAGSLPKQEPTGRLPRDLAHDLNNALSVVVSSLNVIQLHLERGDTNVQKFIDAARQGAADAVDLIRTA